MAAEFISHIRLWVDLVEWSNKVMESELFLKWSEGTLGVKNIKTYILWSVNN